VSQQGIENMACEFEVDNEVKVSKIVGVATGYLK
jgi:hypothetical protein